MIWISGRDDNDLVAALRESGVSFRRYGAPVQALDDAPDGASVMLLADGYPEKTQQVSQKLYRNLLVAGRPISADHVAHSSLRRMAPGFALGEAAGIAAVLSLASRDATSLSVSDLRHALVKHGAIVSLENPR